MIDKPVPVAEFDGYASHYDDDLAQGISVSGEDKMYFARGRIAWLALCIQRLNEHPSSALDFGCGTGSAVPFLFDLIRVKDVIGVDVSSQSIDLAKEVGGSGKTQFLLFNEYHPGEHIDLAFCNGVFHHIPPGKRAAALAYVYRSLRPGGLFAFWENNPWNPGTRYVMSRIPFDRDAIALSVPEARRLLKACGFEVLRIDFLFLFPRALSWLRGLEPIMSRLPLGAQYQVLCRKP